MENKEFQKIVIYFDERGYNEELQGLENNKEHFQQIIDRVLNLGLNIAITPDDFKKLFLNPRLFFVNVLIKDPVNIGGIEIDKNKAFDLLQIPQEITDVIKVLQNEEKKPDFSIYSIENNRIIIKESFKIWLRENRSIYAKTERQKQTFDILTTMVKAFDELIKIGAINHPGKLSDFIHFASGGSYHIKYESINRI